MKLVRQLRKGELSMKRLGILFLLSFLIVGSLVFYSEGVAFACGPIVTDSNFTDWTGCTNITDASGDAAANGDIVAFYWANNPNVNSNFYMIERVTPNPQTAVTYRIYIDINNNGNYAEAVDRQVEVAYTPRTSNSRVDITIKNGLGSTVATHNNNDWGASKNEGAAKVELEATWADLGIGGPGTTIRQYVISVTEGDRAPDSGDIQWSPVPILGYPLLAALVLVATLVIWYYRGRFIWRTTSS